MITPEAIAALQPTPTEWGTSRYREWRRCPHAHHLRYVEGVTLAPPPVDEADLLEPPDESPHTEYKPNKRNIGILGHACLAHSAKGHTWQDVIVAAEAGHGGPELAKLPTTREVARVLEAYESHRNGMPGFDPERWTVVAAERQYRSESLGPLPITCRADLLLEDRLDGSLVIVDHKFVSKTLGDDLSRARRQWRTDWEVLALSHCVQEAHGLAEPPPVMINALIRTKVPKFERLLVELAGTMQMVTFQTELAATDARAIRLGGHRRNLSSCAPFWGEHCWAYAYCWGTQEQRERYYQIRRKES